MRVLGHGIDMVDINWINGQLGSAMLDWVEGVYSTAEQGLADPPPLRSRYYAGRFAAKEAVAKALGTGFSGEVTWRAIEVLRNRSGLPIVRLNDPVLAYARGLGISQWHLSISYSGDLAIASVIACGE